MILLERYSHLGGLASGGMVLVLDDMWDNHQREISVRGTCMSMIERMDALKLVAYPRENEWGQDPASIRRWSRWGTFDFHSHKTPHPICLAASFDPDGWKRVALEWGEELGIELRLHSWFSRALVEDGQIKGVICETKAGREAILGDVVIDAARFAPDGRTVVFVRQEGDRKIYVLRLLDDKGVRRFVNIYANEEDIRFLDKESTRTKDGDTISIVPSIAGGSPAPPPVATSRRWQLTVNSPVP